MGKADRNFGRGKHPLYAVSRILRGYFGEGHYATIETHISHIRDLIAYLGLNDLQLIQPAMLEEYAEHLALRVEWGMAVATAQNRLSAINTLYRALGLPVPFPCPSAVVGQRRRLRETVPEASFRDDGSRHAVAASLQRILGMREREVGLADLRRLLAEGTRYQRVDVREGTKGGRGKECPRWVPVGEAGLDALAAAVGHLSRGERNLVDGYGAYIRWRHSYDAWWARYGQGRAHDLRALFACARYAQLTGFRAPVLAGGREAPAELDRWARCSQTQEMGHGRIDVMGSYYGGTRAASPGADDDGG